jgi:ribose transport system permease protein
MNDAIITGVKTGAASGRRKLTRSDFVAAYMGVFILIGLVVLYSALLGPKFLSYANLAGVLSTLAVSGIIAVGVMIPLAAGVFDVSIAGMMTLSVIGVTAIFQYTQGAFPIVLAILGCLAASLLVGAANGYLVVGEKIDPFIATIGMSAVLIGISGWISGGYTMSSDIPAGFVALGRTQFGQIPITLLYFVVVAIVVWYVLDYTPVGRRIYATGAGREAARLSGVRTNRVIFGAFLASAFLATLAGIVYASRTGAGTPNAGASYLLPAFSAAFLGSTIIKPGRFNIPGLIVAMLIVGVGINGLQLAGLSFWIVDLFQGAALVIAVLLANRGKRGRSTAA